jgi:hypothetical protein
LLSPPHSRLLTKFAGIIASTPRNGATPKPFEQDTSVIRDKEIASGKTGVCGRTAAGGNNDVATQLAGLFLFSFFWSSIRSPEFFAAASQAGLPTAGADGSVTMTLHQVNQDGAGFVSIPRGVSSLLLTSPPVLSPVRFRAMEATHSKRPQSPNKFPESSVFPSPRPPTSLLPPRCLRMSLYVHQHHF